MGERLYLDDLTVGQRFVSGTYKIEAAEIKEFAGKYDPQPFHLDEAAAKDSFFGELVASGWHTAAISMKLLVTGGPPLAGGAIGLGGEISWPRPTRPGDVLRVECEVLGITPSRSRPERGTVIFRMQTRNQRDEIVQSFTGKMIVPKRP
ncbi:MAG: dehydratase [Candidatus Melainabacteria bacterium]|nr:MAG: dehydratase [Candidatus Melainabacteria bacterium]